MIVTLDELKANLRIETDDDDELLEAYLESAEKSVKDVLRKRCISDRQLPTAKIGVLYAATYLYEHREEADIENMMLTLRALLFGNRRPKF